MKRSDVLIDFNLNEGHSFAHVKKLVNSRSATGAEESDINNRIRYKIAFPRSCRLQMSEETLQVLHVVDLLESTEGKSDLFLSESESEITPFWVKN